MVDTDIEDAEKILEDEKEWDEEFGTYTPPDNDPKVQRRNIAMSGSEPHLRDDEAICPVTHLTYFKAMGRSPYVDENGRLV